MQYKPNLQENQVNASSVLAKGYEADIVFWPKNPKANFQNAKMHISYAITKDYENVRLHRREKTKPNSNPIKANSKPIKPNSKPIKPNSNPNKADFTYPKRGKTEVRGRTTMDDRRLASG